MLLVTRLHLINKRCRGVQGLPTTRRLARARACALPAQRVHTSACRACSVRTCACRIHVSTMSKRTWRSGSEVRRRGKAMCAHHCFRFSCFATCARVAPHHDCSDTKTPCRVCGVQAANPLTCPRGFSGVLVMCDISREKQAGREVTDLLTDVRCPRHMHARWRVVRP